MTMTRRAGWAGAFVLALAAGTAVAGVKEGVERGARAASGVVGKTEGAVKRGLGRAADAMERGASATGQAVQRGAKRIGLPTSPASPPAQRGEQPRAP